MANLHLALLFLQVPTILAVCSFPEFLTSVPYWEGQIQNEHYRPDQLLTFRGNTMRMNIYWPSYKVHYLICHTVLEDNRFIVVNNSGGQPVYKCIQFLKRSPYVMQTAESRISKDDDTSICHPEALNLNPWPFLYPVLRGEYVDCPRIGGYDMYMYTFEGNKFVEKCDPFIPARLESECLPGEGMVFNFQHHDCVDGWSMNIKQEALCLGSWTEDNFTFVVLHNKADFFAKIWLLRLPSIPSEYFRAYLMKNILVDTNTTIAKDKQANYIAINMKRRIMKSLCEDESPKCNNSCTSEAMKNYCFKSCKVCEETKLPNCTMRQDSIGLWHDSSISGSKYINITNDTMYIDKMPAMRCVDLSHGLVDDNSGYRSLVSIFDNGCRPRFSCGSFERHSTTIQQFRLSQPLIPSATSIMLTGDVCFPLNFQPDTTPLQDFYRSTRKKNIIKIPKPSNSRPTVTCGLQGPLDVNVTYSSGINCTARVLNCNVTDKIIWQTDDSCPEPGPKLLVFNCLASYSTLTKAFILTERQDDPSDVHCWVYNDDVYKNSPNKLYIMRPADCNLHSMNDIQYSGMKIYESKVSFQQGDFSNVNECNWLSPSKEHASSTAVTKTTSSEEVSITAPYDVDEMHTSTTENAATLEISTFASSTASATEELSTPKEVPSNDLITNTPYTIASSDLQLSTEHDILRGTISITETIEPTNLGPTDSITIALASKRILETTVSADIVTTDQSTKSVIYQTDVYVGIQTLLPEATIITETGGRTTTIEEEKEEKTTSGVNEKMKDATKMHIDETTVEVQTAGDITTEQNRLRPYKGITTEKDEITEAIELITEKMSTEDVPERWSTSSQIEGADSTLKDHPTTFWPSEKAHITDETTEAANSAVDGHSIHVTKALTSIDVISKDLTTSGSMGGKGKPQPRSSQAQMSEVISQADDVQILNTTAHNVTSERINPGTQPTKFRSTIEDAIERARNAVELKDVSSACHLQRLHVFQSLTILTCLFVLQCFPTFLF